MATAQALSSSRLDGESADIGAKFVRWGLRLFIFGLVIGYGPWGHYMHGALEDVQPAFLKNVTLWFGCPWTLATYVAQLGGLAMVVLGLCYVTFARSGAMLSTTAAQRAAPMLCAIGIVAEFVVGFPGYFAVNAVWPNFYYARIDAGRWLWLGMQGACITVYVVGAICAYGGIKDASLAVAGEVAPNSRLTPTTS